MKLKLLLYCTKGKLSLRKSIKDKDYYLDNGSEFNIILKEDYKLNGKIVAECDYEVEKIEWEDFPKFNDDGNIEGFYMYATWKCPQDYILEHSCLTFEQLDNYLGEYKEGYAIHIKNLHIFDEPKELSEYYIKQCQFGKCSTCKYGKDNIICATIDTPITKAPQNMMYAYDNEGNKYVLISIRPEWLYKILNGEKTIEVRKKVLKEMLKND